MAENLNLYQKLAKIRAMSDVVYKNKKGFNYTYADVTSILVNVTAGMKKYGVSLIPRIIPGTAAVSQTVTKNTKVDKKGEPYENVSTEMLVTAEMSFKWVNDENPTEIIEVPWLVVASQGDPSQAFGSGLSYCTRYFLCNYFQIAQSSDTDVDAYRTKQKEAEMSEERAVAKEVVTTLDKVVREFLADNQDKAEDVKKLISKYVKGANYLLITDPALAGKLLEEFKKTFIKEEK